MTTVREYLPAAISWKAADDDVNVVEGYASVFGNVDLHGDVVKRGAFKKTIRERVPSGQVKFLDSHVPDASHVIGTVVEAKEDERGLFIRARLSSAPSAQDLRVKMLEGHLDRMSIGYSTVKDSWQDGDDGQKVRLLEELKLFEVSVVPFPANEEAAISAVKEALAVAGSGLVEAPVAERKALAETLTDALGVALDEPVALVVGRTAADVKSALQPDASKLLDTELRDALTEAARERFGGTDAWVYLEDRELDDAWAVFAIHSDADGHRWMRVSYERDGDDVTLGDDAEEVVVVTDYEPKSATPPPSPDEPEAKPSLKEILRRATAVLEGRDPNEVAEPTQIASLTARLELEERMLREKLPIEDREEAS
jgi:HK97 family phage prohead protease